MECYPNKIRNTTRPALYVLCSLLFNEDIQKGSGACIMNDPRSEGSGIADAIFFERTLASYVAGLMFFVMIGYPFTIFRFSNHYRKALKVPHI